MKKILTLILTLCLMPLCLHPQEKVEKKESDKSYLERLKKLYDEKVESGKKLYDENLNSGKKLSVETKDWLKQDIDNIGDWEYKIVAFEGKAGKEMEKDLNKLGDERWQCFWVEANAKEKVFYFKRTKMSYINKIPAGDLLRIIGTLNNE